MKRFSKELIIILLQIFMYYVFPLFVGPTDAMGMVVIIIWATFVLSTLVGALSKEKLKYFYPILASLLFIPSIFIYYNVSAFVHALWYLIDSSFGLLLGIIFSKIIKR